MKEPEPEQLDRLNSRGEPYTPQQQAVIELIRETNRERKRDGGLLSDGGAFRYHSYSTQVFGPWLVAFRYAFVTGIFLFCTFVGDFSAKQVVLGALGITVWTMFYLKIFGMAHVWRTLIMTLVIVATVLYLKFGRA